MAAAPPPSPNAPARAPHTPPPGKPQGKKLPAQPFAAWMAKLGLGAGMAQATPPVAVPHAPPHGAPKPPGQPQPTAQPHGAKDDEPLLGRRHDRRDDDLDPRARHAAQLAPPAYVTPLAQPAPPPPADAPAAAQAHASLEELLPALVRRVAWSGDGKRGTVRMELGAGELAGATLLVSSDAGRVRVELNAPPGTDVTAWKDRLRARLESRGLSIESLEVT